MISIVCPIYNEEKYIASCIDSILQQDYPIDDWEILFVDGMSKDKTREIVNEYVQKYPFIKLLDNPHKIVPYAMNIGIEAAKGDVIIRLDAHCSYPTNYFSELVRNLEELPNAENVGGVCVTLPCNESTEATGIAIALSSSFGMGDSSFRVGADEIKKVDTVPFGCFRKTLFDKIGLYDLELVRNQDDELNGRIIKNGGDIFLIPSLKIEYFARDKVAKMRKMFYQYGLFKPLVNKKLGSPATVRQFFPLAFLLGVVLGGVLSVFFKWIRDVYFAVLILYFGIGIYIGIKESLRTKKWGLILLMPWLYLNIHLSYGWGYLVGIWKLITKQSFAAQLNR